MKTNYNGKIDNIKFEARDYCWRTIWENADSRSQQVGYYVLDNDETCRAGNIASHYVKGSNVNYDDVYQFGKLVDVLAFEMENVNIEALKTLNSEGLRIAHDPEILELIQYKGLQKEFYKRNGIPTSDFSLYDSVEDILKDIFKGKIAYPFVQKNTVSGV